MGRCKPFDSADFPFSAGIHWKPRYGAVSRRSAGFARFAGEKIRVPYIVFSSLFLYNIFMRIPKIYLETSIFNFVFADNDTEKQQDTLKLFEDINNGKYEPYTSDAVLEELLRTSEPKQSKMTELIPKYKIITLPASDEAERLADVYVSEGIIPVKYRTDGVHIALTAVNSLDFIVSYNFRHIVKRKTIEMTELVNYREGYRKVGIYSPTEVIEDDEE